VHKFVRSFNASKYVIFHTNNKKPINYVFSSIIHDCRPTFGQVFDPTLEEIRWFGREKIFEPILELSVVVEGNCPDCWRERAEEVVIRWGKVWKLGRMWKNLPVEFLNGRFRHVCSVCGRASSC
jgi:hypothetical protein